MILKGYVFGVGYAALCLILSFILYKLGLPKKYTRKVVHVLVGFEWVILYHYMGAGLHFLLVCLVFLLLLSVSYFGKLMPMISSDSDNAPGTVYYALAMTAVAAVGCFLPDIMLPFGIGVMCTSIGDGLAGVVGQSIKKGNPRIYADKTLLGSLTNFVASTSSALVLSSLYSIELSVWICLAIGILSVGLELITPYGLDNISITWAVTALAYSYMYFTGVNEYILPIIFTPFIIAFSLSKKALTRGGVVSAIVLDLAVSIAFGNTGFIILCSFFVGAVFVDKIKKRIKNQSRIDDKKDDDCRNYMQVFANGLIAFVSAVAFLITKNIIFAVSFVASLAEAFSDTVASGIGAFSSSAYDPFRRCKCENGISGGMSLEGTLASIVGACLISYIAYAIGFVGYGIREFFIVAISAILGSLLDSFLGSVFQVKYKCRVCGKITEREVHCLVPADIHSGYSIIDNDVVNMISCAAAAILATALTLLV